MVEKWTGESVLGLRTSDENMVWTRKGACDVLVQDCHWSDLEPKNDAHNN